MIRRCNEVVTRALAGAIMVAFTQLAVAQGVNVEQHGVQNSQQYGTGNQSSNTTQSGTQNQNATGTGNEQSQQHGRNTRSHQESDKGKHKGWFKRGRDDDREDDRAIHG